MTSTSLMVYAAIILLIALIGAMGMGKSRRNNLNSAATREQLSRLSAETKRLKVWFHSIPEDYLTPPLKGFVARRCADLLKEMLVLDRFPSRFLKEDLAAMVEYGQLAETVQGPLKFNDDHDIEVANNARRDLQHLINYVRACKKAQKITEVEAVRVESEIRRVLAISAVHFYTEQAIAKTRRNSPREAIKLWTKALIVMERSSDLNLFHDDIERAQNRIKTLRAEVAQTRSASHDYHAPGTRQEMTDSHSTSTVAE